MADAAHETPDPRLPDQYVGQVYESLRALAAARLRQENAGHTLQPTALVHEAYLKLAQQSRAEWNDEAHFFAVAAEAIRRILVDHARMKQAQKRQTPGERVTIATGLDAALGEREAGAVDLLVLDEALRELAQVSPRQARVVELRFFAGLDVAAVARHLNVSENTVKGDWRFARAWLQSRLEGTGQGGER